MYFLFFRLAFLFCCLFLIGIDSSFAFFEKRYAYRMNDNRPIFRENYTSQGIFYIGGVFSILKGEISDSRSLGLDQKYNKQLYSMEYNYADKNLREIDFSTKTNSHGTGAIVFGYAPRTNDYFGIFRHEIEIGAGSHSRDMNHVDTSNTFCLEENNCGSDSYSSLKYTLKQRYIMYNLYIHPFMKTELNYFGGAGFGVFSTTTTFFGEKYNGTTKTVGEESEILEAKNRISTGYSIFFGATYDVSDSIVIQGKIKGVIVNSAESPNSTGMKYDLRYQPSSVMTKMVGIEIGALFGL